MRTLLPIFLLLTAASSSFAAVDRQLLALAPPGTTFIAAVDVSQAKNSQFGQYLLNRAPSDDRNFENMIQATGFDPRRDLQEIVLLGAASAGETGHFAVLARGTFDVTHIRTGAKAKGVVIESYHGTELFLDVSERRRNAFAFLERDIAVMGDVATVQRIISNRGAPAALDGTLDQLIASVGPNNDAWFVSLTSGSYLASHIPAGDAQAGARQALSSILQSSGGIQFGDMVRLSFDATARSAKDAQSLADVLHFAGSMAQVAGQNNPVGNILASAFEQMTIDVSGDTVRAAISVPEKSLEQLAEAGPAAPHRHSMRQR